MFQFDYNCSHVVNIEKDTRFKILNTIKEMYDLYCKNIIPYCCIMPLCYKGKIQPHNDRPSKTFETTPKVSP